MSDSAKVIRSFIEEYHEKLEKEGFEGIVERVAVIEKGLGIFDLRQFTPSDVCLVYPITSE